MREVRAASGWAPSVGRLLPRLRHHRYSFIRVLIHSFTHSFMSQPNRFPRPDCPHPKSGASLLALGRVSHFLLPAGSAIEWPAAAQEAAWSCPGTTQPRPCSRPVLIGRAGAGLSAWRSDPKPLWEERKFLRLGKGQGVGQAGRGVSRDSKNCVLCTLRSWVLLAGLFREDRDSE